MTLPTLGQSFVTKRTFGSVPSTTAGYVGDIGELSGVVIYTLHIGGKSVSVTNDVFARMLSEPTPIVDRIRACIQRYKART